MDNKQTKGHKALLTYITTAQKAEFHNAVCSQLVSLVPKVNGTAPAFNIYNNAAQVLITAYNQRNKSIETEELVIKNSKREGTVKQLISRINYHSKFPLNEEEAEAAYILKFETDAYKNAKCKNYLAETANLRSLIADLLKHADCLALFGLNSLIERLEIENNDFEEVHIIRTNALEAKRKRGTLTQVAKRANKRFEAFCTIMNGISLMPLDANTRDAVDEIIRIINSQIHQYTTIYHRHAGIALHKKKEDGGEKTD